VAVKSKTYHGFDVKLDAERFTFSVDFDGDEQDFDSFMLATDAIDKYEASKTVAQKEVFEAVKTFTDAGEEVEIIGIHAGNLNLLTRPKQPKFWKRGDMHIDTPFVRELIGKMLKLREEADQIENQVSVAKIVVPDIYSAKRSSGGFIGYSKEFKNAVARAVKGADKLATGKRS
jgi:hypothetical protein